jgi:hypothetical protein
MTVENVPCHKIKLKQLTDLKAKYDESAQIWQYRDIPASENVNLIGTMR